MSDFVVHFTKPTKETRVHRQAATKARKGLLSLLRAARSRDQTGGVPWLDILGEGQLRPGPKPLGAARKIPELLALHRVVCLSEIPLDKLDRLVERRSLYGIGFRKDIVVAKGGAPLWYLDKDGEQTQTIMRLIQAATNGGVDPLDPLWTLTPFIDHPGDYAGVPYRFEWEREWRIIGDFNFTPEDVAFLFLPENEHDRARQFFADVEVEHSGPAYLGPYIDPRWEMDAIQDRLKNLPPVPPPSAGVRPWWD